MMLTMHSMLRDRYSHRAFLLDALVFLTSIIIAALVFVDPGLLTWLPWSQASSRIAIGVVAIATIFLSLIAWRVDWKGKTEAHERAAGAYTQAKFRLGSPGPNTDEAELHRLLTQYEEAARSTITIPDSQFLRLKSAHYTKILISRLLDRYPAASILMTRMRLKVRHTRRALSHRDDEL